MTSIRPVLGPVGSLAARVRRSASKAVQGLRERTTASAQARVETIREREVRHQALAEGAAAAFAHGYLILHGVGRVPDQVRAWPTQTVSGHTYYLHPRTRVTVAGDQLVLLGDPVSVSADSTDADQIADLLLRAAREQGRDALLRAAAELGGRWTLLHHDAAGLLVVTDALASQPVIYGTGPGLALASHEVLVRQSLGHDAAGALAPDELLEVAAGAQPADLRGGVSTRQWWPVEPLAKVSVDEAYPEFRNRLSAHVRLLTTLGTPAIGLSNSVASKAVLGAYLPHRQPEDIACTLLRTRAAKRSRLPGLFAASRLAQHVGITHRIFRWETLDEKHPLALAVAATYPDLEHPFGRAVAWWGSLVDDAVQLLDRAPDLELLQAGGRTASEGEHSPLRPSELQLACQEADFSHRALLTFNDRRLLELLCSVPANGRRRQALLRRFVADHPELVPPPTWGEQLQAAEQDG